MATEEQQLKSHLKLTIQFTVCEKLTQKVSESTVCYFDKKASAKVIAHVSITDEEQRMNRDEEQRMNRPHL